MIVSVNDELAAGGISIEYGTQEVVDTVKHFLDHAAEGTAISCHFALFLAKFES